MQLNVKGADTFAANGGTAFDPAKPTVIFLHGSGMDHSVWGLQTRWFAGHGFSVLAPDLPGHGRSQGPLLTTIADMADWVAALQDAAGIENAVLVGHSMGSLIALEAAARHPQRVRALGLVGSAATMPVHPDILTAADQSPADAFAMVNIWGHGAPAVLGGSQAPGTWLIGLADRVLANAPKGALAADMRACNDYAGGAAAAATVQVPAALVLGGIDRMTPAAQGRALGQAIAGATVTVAPGTGHMLMTENPDFVLDALIALVKRL